MRLRNRLCLLAAVLLVICNAACDRRTPSNVLSKGEMTEVLTDYHLARAIAGNLNSDQRYEAPLLIDGVFRKHGITKAVFDSSMVWYTRNPQELAIIYNRVHALLQEKISESKARNPENASRRQTASYSDSYPSGDSVNLWRGAPLLQMNRMLSTRRDQFVIGTDTTFYPSDIIEWALHAQMLPRSGEGGKAIMYLMVRYAPDSVMVSSRIIKENGTYKLTIRNNSGREMRQIWGFIHYFPGEKTGDAQNQILIDRIRLMRYHSKQNPKKKISPHNKQQIIVEKPQDLQQVQPTQTSEIQQKQPDEVSQKGASQPEEIKTLSPVK